MSVILSSVDWTVMLLAKLVRSLSPFLKPAQFSLAICADLKPLPLQRKPSPKPTSPSSPTPKTTAATPWCPSSSLPSTCPIST